MNRTHAQRELIRETPTDTLEYRADSIHNALLILGADGAPNIVRHLRRVRLAINVELIDRYVERGKHSGDYLSDGSKHNA